MSAGLSAAIELLYASFTHPRPDRIDGCPCCVPPDALRTLVTVPRERLSALQLEGYARTVMLTVGGVTDLRYLWPRLAEIMIANPLQVDREIVFAALRRAEWHTWPVEEQRALDTFVRAVIADMADCVYDGDNMDSWICAFGQFLDDVTLYLDPLLSDTLAARTNLLSLYEWNARAVARGGLSNAFWDDERPSFPTMIAWLRRPDVLSAVDRAYVDPGSRRAESS